MIEQEQEICFTDATRDRTVKNMAKSLRISLNRKYKKGTKDIVESFLRIDGIHPDNFDAVSALSKFINGKLNDVSIDANANKSEKTVAALSSETSAPKDKAVGFDYLYQEMKFLFGKEEAKRLTGEMYDYSLGISDSTKILLNYCYSFNFSRLITEGRPFGQLPSLPCKNLRSYMGALTETVHQLAQHLAGAIAVGSFFFDVGHLCLYKHKLDIRELKTNKWFRKEIENSYQHFVHSMNMLSRDAAQSPFTNISINDREKIKKIVLEMPHMFPFEELPINDSLEFSSEEEKSSFCINYIVDYITDLQDIFLDFFDKGAPSLGGAQYRFPVSTLCLSKRRNRNTCDWELIDKKFLRNVCKREIYRYNIFSSEGTKFASCCFNPEQEVEISDGQKKKFRFVDLFNMTRYSDEEISSAKILPNDIELGKEVVTYCNGQEIRSHVICLDYDDVIYDIMLDNGCSITTTKDHPHVVWFNDDFEIDVNSEHLFIGNEILTNSGHVKVKDIKMHWYTGKVYCMKTKTEEHRFDLPNGVITHNCRLVNNSELMDAYSAHANSFGAGGSMDIGSHRVVTINLPRIAIEAESEREFFNIFNARLESAAKILKAHKSLLKKLTNAGLQMFISNGWIRMDRLFSTFGIIGTYECEQIFYKKFGKNKDILAYILQFMNSKVKEYSEKYGIAGNIEQIPGESMAIRMCKADKLIFGDSYLPWKMYSNQIVPPWQDVDIYKRMKRDGECNGYISGGGICKFTIGERVTSKQAENAIMKAVIFGCEHFALDAFYSQCENGHIHIGKNNVCPICKGKIVDYFIRIVGYFIRVSDASIERIEEILNRNVGKL